MSLLAAETRRANWSYDSGNPGFYVVNRYTGRAVAGPFDSEAEAEAEKQRRDERWPDMPSTDLVIARRNV